MKAINTIGLIALSITLTGGALVTSIPFLLTDVAYSDNSPFQISASSDTLKLEGGYSNQEKNFTLKTRLGNAIEFGYKYGMEKDNAIGQFKSKGVGKLYNNSPIHYIRSILINYDSKCPMKIAVGDTINPEMNFQDIESGVMVEFNSIDAAYFTLKTGDNAVDLNSITIVFDCFGAEPPVIPDSSENSSSELDPNIEKTATLNVKNLTTGIIPTSYTSSGVKFSVNDINFFANYITNDYKGGFANNYIFLRENERGYIMNTNPINNLKKISFAKTVNPTSFKVYVSKDFDKNWVPLNTYSTNIEIPDGYSYFKITSSNKNFGFNDLNITYNSASSQINEVYTLKNISPIASKSQADLLIKVSSEPFTNNSYWTNLGYAQNIEEAKAEAIGKNGQRKQSGYDQYSDYQIDFNKNVVLDYDYNSYRVCDMEYGDNGNSFRINMLDPNIQGPVIYKDCAYTFIEDIAAYITAFGDVPPNMRYNKDRGSTAIKEWGDDARVNYASYSNHAVGNYSYETEVSTHRYLFNPTQNSQDYWYNYFESDYGASVCNDEPYQHTSGYAMKKYNENGKITRGALRFVWTYSFTATEHSSRKSQDIKDSYDRNVFYTSTHYNDFQQYLNYYGGWSLKFGNTMLGNPWGRHIKGNHLKESPQLTLVSLNDIRK